MNDHNLYPFYDSTAVMMRYLYNFRDWHPRPEAKWRGRLSTQSNAQAFQYFGALYQIKGEKYLRKLAQQSFTLRSGAAREVAQLVAAGKVPVMLPVSISHPVALQKQGAPIGYKILEPAPTAAGYLGILSRAPHAHAAALLVDFILSDAGQEIMINTGSGAVRKGINNPYPNFKKLYIDFLVPQNHRFGTLCGCVDREDVVVGQSNGTARVQSWF